MSVWTMERGFGAPENAVPALQCGARGRLAEKFDHRLHYDWVASSTQESIVESISSYMPKSPTDGN